MAAAPAPIALDDLAPEANEPVAEVEEVDEPAAGAQSVWGGGNIENLPVGCARGPFSPRESRITPEKLKSEKSKKQLLDFTHGP